MAGRIPKSFIDELIARADIVEVVGARVTLKRAGSNYKGLCPFHGEKTPSFTVSPSKGFYHCFGCSAHGTAIGFLMAYDNLEFPEAVEALAEMMGLEVPRENTGVPGAQGRERRALRAAARSGSDLSRRAAQQREGDRVLEEARHRRTDRGPLRHRLCAGRVGHRAEAARHLGCASRETHASRARRRERLGPPLRPVSRSHHVPDPQRAARPDHRLRRPRARLRRAEILELAGDADLPQGPRAVRPLRGAAESRGARSRSSSSRATSTSRASFSTASRTPSRRSARRRRRKICAASRASRTASCSASTATARAAPQRGVRWRPRCRTAAARWSSSSCCCPRSDDPDSFVRTKGADAFRSVGARRPRRYRTFSLKS